MKRLSVAASVVLASCGTQVAHAQSWFQFEAGVGATYFQTEDGRWYQKGMAQSDVHSIAPAFSLGLTGPVIARGDWGVDWHLDYADLGRAAADCMCTPDDGNYDANRHIYTPKNPLDLAYFTGDGHLRGFALTVEPYRWWKGLRWGFEAGAYINHWNWDEGVYNVQHEVGGAHANEHVSQSGWGVVPVVGLNVGNGKYTVAIRHYFTSREQQGNRVPPVWKDTNTVEFKMKF